MRILDVMRLVMTPDPENVAMALVTCHFQRLHILQSL